MNKAQKQRLIYSLKMQFGYKDTMDKSKELFNKNLDDLNEIEINKVFDFFRNKKQVV